MTIVADSLDVDALLDRIRRYRQPWMDAARCAEDGAPSMFPSSTNRAAVAAALAVCQSCAVLDACRDWCICTDPDPLPVGIAAGMTASERRARRRTEPR